uniref:Uncharacterized protein n=3 Tax=Erwinia amylovora TaxID=552 RepID=E5B9F7_ERWAM|nr:hypothetical protein predicted by Glimmer/Critica [Erwinia amylovora ATCC BAA-2158]
MLAKTTTNTSLFPTHMTNPRVASEPEERWFDAKDEMTDIWHDVIEAEADDAWYDAEDGPPAENSPAAQSADPPVSPGEDCLRGLRQVIRIMGDAGQSELISVLMAKMFPDLPAGIIMAAGSLYTAIIEKRETDSAVLHALGLMSGYLPAISGLAAFIRSTLISCPGGGFLQETPGGHDGHQDELYTALALAAVAASCFITGNSSPQRAVCRVPAALTRLLLRACKYWRALGVMVQNGTLAEETVRPPAFEVDSSIETTACAGEASGSGVADGAAKTVITGLTSNSTVTPEAYTKATAANRQRQSRGRAYGVAEQAHVLATQKLMMESGLSGLDYCATRRTRTRQRQGGVDITHTHFNTRCDATPHPVALPASATVFQEQAQEPVPQRSQAADRPYVYTVIPVAASASVLSANPRTLAMKSRVVMAAGAVTALTGLAFGGRKLWDTFISPHRGEDIAPSPEAHKGNRQHHRTVTEKTNTRLARKMQKLGILDETRRAGSFQKEEIIAAVGIALFAPDPHFVYGVTEFDNRLQEVAKTILRAEELYGGWADEGISAVRAGMVVRSWLFKNVLGMPAESFLARQLAAFTNPEDFTASVMNTLLESDVLRSAGIIDLEALSFGQTQQFEKFWDYALDNTLPVRRFAEAGGANSLSATDDDFVWLHSGALWLKDAGATLNEFSAEACQTFGKALWQRAEAGDMNVSYLRYLTLPALLFEAVNHPGKAFGNQDDEFIHRLKAVNDYAEFRRITALYYADFRAKVDEFNGASKDWKSRGAIADNYVGQCPDQTLIDMGDIPLPPVLGGRPYPFNSKDLPSDPVLKSGKKAVRQAYLNGKTTPGCPLTDVTAEFTSITRRLAVAFSQVDEYIIGMTLAALDKGELDFIHSEQATIRQVTSKLSRVAPSIKEGVKELKNTDLFSVVVGKDERIYTFVAKKEGGYDVRRVDRDVAKYIEYDLFGSGKGSQVAVRNDGVVLFPTTVSGKPRVPYVQSFSVFPSPIKGADVTLVNLVKFIKDKHQIDFYKKMWASGYDASTNEKIRDFFKHLIPFYDCVNDKFPANLASCIVDALAFIPLFGQAASLSGKFGISLSRAAGAGMKFLSVETLSQNIVKTAGKQALKEVSLPTISELASVGKTAIRTLDPGFELLTGVGKYSYRELKKLTDWVRAGKDADEIKKMESLLQRMKAVDVISPEEPVAFKQAFLPNSAIKVPIKSLRGEHEKEVYVIINPETGEALGGAYYLDKGNLRRISDFSGKKPHQEHVGDLEKKGADANLKNGNVKAENSHVPHRKDLVIQCTHRFKRGITELSENVAFELCEPNDFIKFNLEDGRSIQGFLPIKLLEINPVRYRLLKGSMHNAYGASQSAAKKISKMTNSQIKDSFAKYTGVKINDCQAVILKERVLEIEKACKIYFLQGEDRIVLLSGFVEGDPPLFFNREHYGVFIFEKIFEMRNSALFEHVLIHEASHAINTKDYFYLPKYIIFPDDKTITEFCANLKEEPIDIYKKHIAALAGEPGMSNVMYGNDMYRELNFPLTPVLPWDDAAVNSEMLAKGVTLSDWTINNADSLSFYVLALGTDGKGPHRINVDRLFEDEKNSEKFPTLTT